MTKEDTELSKGDAAKDGLKSQGKACVSGFSKSPTGAYAGEAGSIPGLGRSPQGGNGNPLQCSCWKSRTLLSD